MRLRFFHFIRTSDDSATLSTNREGRDFAATWRAVVAAFSFGIPLVAMAMPGWEGITLGTVVYAILHYTQSQAGL